MEPDIGPKVTPRGPTDTNGFRAAFEQAFNRAQATGEPLESVWSRMNPKRPVTSSLPAGPSSPIPGTRGTLVGEPYTPGNPGATVGKPYVPNGTNLVPGGERGMVAPREPIPLTNPMTRPPASLYPRGTGVAGAATTMAALAANPEFREMLGKLVDRFAQREERGYGKQEAPAPAAPPMQPGSIEFSNYAEDIPEPAYPQGTKSTPQPKQAAGGSSAFDSAFAKARQEGKSVFEHNGKLYTTQLRTAPPGRYDSMPFGQALRAAQQAGEQEIPWKGKYYKVAF